MAPSRRVYRAICASCESDAAACRLVLPIAANHGLSGTCSDPQPFQVSRRASRILALRAVQLRTWSLVDSRLGRLTAVPDSGDERTIPFVVLCVGDCPGNALDELL